MDDKEENKSLETYLDNWRDKPPYPTEANFVPGEGSLEAKIVFIGEAPGRNEDLQKRPFVGAAGKLLNEMLESIGLQRENVYITNIVKYRPPNNRDPLPEEIEANAPLLKRELEIIQPKLIVILGRHAMNNFFPNLKISQSHGQAKRLGEQVYYILYHPAAALYQGSLKEILMKEFKRIPQILEKINELSKNEENNKPSNSSLDENNQAGGENDQIRQGELF